MQINGGAREAANLAKLDLCVAGEKWLQESYLDAGAKAGQRVGGDGGALKAGELPKSHAVHRLGRLCTPLAVQ